MAFQGFRVQGFRFWGIGGRVWGTRGLFGISLPKNPLLQNLHVVGGQNPA